MASDAKIGLLVPGGFGGAPPSMAEFNDFFRRADELGYDSLWVIDRLFHNINIIDPMTLLACAAAVTDRIRLGTSVLLFVMRNPALVAKTISTIDYLSGGRVTLGISLGGRDNEYEPMGVDVKRRVSRFTEGLEVMRRLWNEDGVTHHGRHFDMDNVSVNPKPVQKPGIPVIFGGTAEGVFQRTGELADGWVAGGVGNAEGFGQALEKIKGYAQAAGRDPASLDSAKLMYCYVDDDRERANRNWKTSPTLTMVPSTTWRTTAPSVPESNARRSSRGTSITGPKRSSWDRPGRTTARSSASGTRSCPD